MRFLLLLLLISFLPAGLARAADPLNFRTKTDDVREKEMLSYLQADYGFDISAPHSIAATDMNGDGVPEWIVRQGTKGCENNATCRFFITGLSERKPLLLSQLYASKIGLLDKNRYGVVALAVYNDPADDFNYLEYYWDPKKFSFQPF